MATNPVWQISGDYFESCSCDFLCPCLPSNLAAEPTKGDCYFAFAFRINQGSFDGLSLNDLAFLILGRAPGRMDQGNLSVGVITDERATPEQQQALVTIASGQAGGPMAGLGPLIGNFLGVEARKITVDGKGQSWSVTAGDALDQAVAAVPSASNPGESMYIENTIHPANSRLALARATRSHLHAFGLDWDDDSGRNNGHFAPFNWRSN